MAAQTPTYDLMLLLDPAADEDRRKKVLADAEAAIRASGEVIGVKDYGLRATAYELDRKPEAEYHLIQFHGDRDLLARLDRTLRITDGVERFRIIKLAPGIGAPPEMGSSAPTPGAPVTDDDGVPAGAGTAA